MQVRNALVSGLILILLAGAITVYFYPVNTSSSANTSISNRVEKIIDKEQRFQCLLTYSENEQLSLVYLISYEPISENFSAIYIPPETKILSRKAGPPRPIKSLYNEVGIETLRRDLENEIQVDIPFWIDTRNHVLEKLVNLLGGTQIYVPGNRPGNNGNSSVHWADGQMAKNYVTTAYEDLTQGRRYRHKTFFFGMTKWVKRHPHLIESPRFWKHLQGLMQTNLSREEMKSLVTIFTKLKSQKTRFPAALHSSFSKSDKKALNEKRIQNMLPRHLKEEIKQSKPQKTITVEVKNGVGEAGLAGDVRDYLQDYEDIDVVEIGDADKYDYKKTQIIDRSGHPQSAYRIMDVLGLGEFQSKPSESALVDVTIIVGRDLQKHLKYLKNQ
ncbi:MAG: LCP family protein [bacterium]